MFILAVEKPSLLSSMLLLTGSGGINLAKAWSWPLTFNLCQGVEYMELRLHIPLYLPGMHLSTGNFNFNTTKDN